MKDLFKKFLIFWYKQIQEFTIRHQKFTNRSRLFRSFRRRSIIYIQSKCSSNFLVLDGRQMHVDHDEYLKILFEDSSIMAKFVKNNIKKGDIVLDLGANIGYWTCLLAELVGKNGHVYAFEPEPHNFQLLKKNVEINKYQNVTLEQKAISNKNGKTNLFISDVKTDHRIYDWSGNQESIEVDMIQLDDYFVNNKINIDYIKSNLQGADFAAVQGMRHLIKNSKNIKMIVEYHPDTLIEFGFDPNEFINFLINENFILYDVGENKMDKLISDQIFQKYVIGKGNGTSFLCLKKI